MSPAARVVMITPARVRTYEERSESSEDSSTKRETAFRAGSPSGSESVASKNLDLLEELDSEDGLGVGDNTPIYELYSSDPSTAFEATTVVENVVPDIIAIGKDVTSRVVSGAVTRATALVAERERQEEIASTASTSADVSFTRKFDEQGSEGSAATESAPGASKHDKSPKATELFGLLTDELAEVIGSQHVPASEEIRRTPVGDKQRLSSEDVAEKDDEEKAEDHEASSEGEPAALVSSEQKITDLLLAGAAIFCRRTLSGELSTVSEVSEEMSNHKSSDVSISSPSSSSPSASRSKSNKTNESRRTATLQRHDSSSKTSSKQASFEAAVLAACGSSHSTTRSEGSGRRSEHVAAEIESGRSSAATDESTSDSLSLDVQERGESESHEPASTASDVSRERGSSAVERTTASIPALTNEDVVEDRTRSDERSSGGQEVVEEDVPKEPAIKKASSGSEEGSGSGFRLVAESKLEATSDLKASPPVREGVAVGTVEAELSQATERDVAMFSLEQQSSQEIDEESLSTGAAGTPHSLTTHTHSAEGHLSADAEELIHFC